MKNQSVNSDTATRLKKLGFSFSPFERLEASNDPHISEYLIGHEMFAVAWEQAPTVLYAPAGGGKTAMRIYTLRTCWLSGQRQRFPISYDLPFFSNQRGLSSSDGHWRALAAAAATDVLLACAYRPELYLQLSSDRRLYLLSLLKQALPINLEWSLGLLAETFDPQQLSTHLDRTYILPEPPARHALLEFCQIAQNDLSHKQLDNISSDSLFDDFLKWVINDWNFASVFILLDGVDGTSNLANSPIAQFQVIESLCKQAPAWSNERVFLKAFLPLEMEMVLGSHTHDFSRQSLHAVITWDASNLAEILRRRVQVASKGKFNSLDALSSHALRDVETLIAKRARPLPREAIVLANKVLESYLAHCEDLGYLEPEDLEQAVMQYEKDCFLPKAFKP
jgi:hypothetical protein